MQTFASNWQLPILNLRYREIELCKRMWPSWQINRLTANTMFSLRWDKKKEKQHQNISSVGSPKLVSLIFTFSGETKNWITFARSVLYCWKSDRIIFSNIQIHCYWCFELPIKISHSLWRVSLELCHFFVKTHPVTTLWASFSWQNLVSQ